MKRSERRQSSVRYRFVIDMASLANRKKPPETTCCPSSSSAIVDDPAWTQTFLRAEVVFFATASSWSLSKTPNVA
jgi:hypothetical protein